MKQFWTELLSYGPRPVGTAAHDKVTEYIYQQMKKFSDETRKDSFTFNGWKINQFGKLCMTKPEEFELDTLVFLGSGSGNFEGTVKKIGKNYVWNMYGWDLYSVVSEGNEILAYISGRNEGGVLSQTLIEGNIDLPHFIISAEQNEHLSRLLDQGECVQVRGMADCTAVMQMEGNNIVVPFRFGAADDPDIIICAHYDSMYNTVGAYDNGAGTAVLMALAEKLSKQELKKNIVLLFTDAEECRLEGAKHFAETVNPESVEYLLNIDGIGRGEEIEIWCGGERFCRRIENLIEDYPEILQSVMKWPPPAGSDHAPFYSRGIPVCMYTFNDQDIIHTERDVYQESMLRNMKRMEKLVLHTLQNL